METVEQADLLAVDGELLADISLREARSRVKAAVQGGAIEAGRYGGIRSSDPYRFRCSH